MGGNRRNRGNGRANGSSRGKGQDNNNYNAASVESLPSSPTSSIPTASSSVTPTSALPNGNNTINNESKQIVKNCSSVFTGTSTPSSQQIPIPSLPGQQEMSATRVYVRVRPFNERERDLATASASITSETEITDDTNKNTELLGRAAKTNMTLHSTMQINSTNPSAITTLDPANNFMPKTTYYFEKCFDSVTVVDKSLEEVTVSNLSCNEMTSLSEDQHTIYTEVGLPVLKSALDGYNGCIFAYGQTGSGKTYTMMGPSSEFANVAKDVLANNFGSSSKSDNASVTVKAVTQLEGIIPRLARELFASLREKRNIDSAHSFRVELEYFEIYNEKVIDLLCSTSNSSSNNNELRVRNSSQGPYIEHLTRKHVESEMEIVNWLRFGNAERHTASTKMNERSSRSHAILSLHLVQMRISEDDVGSRMTSKVNLVDLAGSERTGMSGAVGAHFNEAVKINLSLTTLGRVIDALADLSQGKRNIFCPYRDSNLTWILMDSLGGNSKTSMIATISPHPINFEEANQTLRYAARAKQIVAKVIVNEDPQIRQIKLLTAEVERLQHLLNGEVNTDDYVDNLRERVGVLQASLEEKEMVIARHEAELDALHTLNSKLQAANEALQTSATGRELSRLRIELAKMKEENSNNNNNKSNTSTIQEQNKILQSKLEEVNKQNAELERQVKLQEKQSVSNEREQEMGSTTTVSKEVLSSATIEMLQKLHLNDVNVKTNQIDLRRLVEELTSYGYKTHVLLSDAQATNMTLLHKYQHELSDEVHKREAREWDVLRELGKQLLERHCQAAESMAALRSVHSQLAVNTESNTRNGTNERTWRQMLKEKEEELVELDKTAENDKRELQRKINELNEMNTRLNLELRQIRVDWRREKEKHQGKEQKLQSQVNSMSSELRSLKANLMASPKWNKNSFAIMNSSNNSNSNSNNHLNNIMTQRTSKEVNSVTTAKATPSGRPSLINASFAFTPRVPRSANILRNNNIINNNNNKNINNTNEIRTAVSGVVGGRGRGIRSVQSSEQRDGSQVVYETENDIVDYNKNNNENDNIHNILIESFIMPEREESCHDAHRSVCQPISPRHSRSRSTVQPATKSRSHSHSSLSNCSSSLSSLSSELYEIQEHAERIKSIYESMITQLVRDEGHERMCITENESDYFNVINAWTTECTVQVGQFLHKMEKLQTRLTEQHDKFVEERELIRNTVKEEEHNQWNAQLHEVHSYYAILHKRCTLRFEELQEEQSAAFVEHEKVWNDAMQSNVHVLQEKLSKLEQEKMEMIKAQNEQICLQEEKMHDVQTTYNTEMEILRNTMTTLQDEVKFLRENNATLQAERQLHEWMHVEHDKLVPNEERNRIDVINQEHTMFHTLALQLTQECEKIREANVLRMKEATEKLLEHAKEELHMTLLETQEKMCQERERAASLEQTCQCIAALLQLTEQEACAREKLMSGVLTNTGTLCSNYVHMLHKDIHAQAQCMRTAMSNEHKLLTDKHKEWEHEQMLLNNTVTRTYFVDEEKTCRANLHALACEQFTDLFTHHYNKLLVAAHDKELASIKECAEAMYKSLHEELERSITNLHNAEEMWAEKVKVHEEEMQKIEVQVQILQRELEYAQSAAAKMKRSLEENKQNYTEQLHKQSETHKEECVQMKRCNEELLVKLQSAETRVHDHEVNEARLRKEVSELSRHVRAAQQQAIESRRVALREQEERARHQCERDELLTRLAMERMVHSQLLRKSKSHEHMVQDAFDEKELNWLHEKGKLTSRLESSEAELLSVQTCNKELEENLRNAELQMTTQAMELSELHTQYVNQVQMHAKLTLYLEELQNRLNITEAEMNAWATSLHDECNNLQTLNNIHYINSNLLICVQTLESAEFNSRYELCRDEHVSVNSIWHEFTQVVLSDNVMLSERVETLRIMNEEKEHSWNEVNEKKDNEIARLQEDLEFNTNLFEYDECNTGANQLISHTVGKSGIMGNRSESKTISSSTINNNNNNNNINNHSFAVNALDLSNIESTSAPRTSRDHNKITDTSSISFTPCPITPRAYSYNTSPPVNKNEMKGNTNRGYLTHLIETLCRKRNNNNTNIISGTGNISMNNNNSHANESTLIPISCTNSVNNFAEHAMQSANLSTTATPSIELHQQSTQSQETATPVHEFTLTNMFSRRGSTLTNLILPDKLNYDNNNVNNHNNNKKALHTESTQFMESNNENEIMPQRSFVNDETTQEPLISVASRSTREMEKQRAISLHDFLASGQMDNGVSSSSGGGGSNNSTLTKSRVPGRIHKKSHTPNLTLGYEANSNASTITTTTIVDADKHDSGVCNTNSYTINSYNNNHKKLSSTFLNKRGIIPRNTHGSNAGLISSINKISNDYCVDNENNNSINMNDFPSNVLAMAPANVNSTPINDECNEEAEISQDVPDLPLQWRKESQINEINGNNKNKFVNNNNVNNYKDSSSKSGKYLKREAVYTQLNTYQTIQQFGGKEN